MKRQTEWIANYLRIHGRISNSEFQSLTSAGDSSLSARISEMKQAGWEITKNGRYFVLVSEPITLDSVPVEVLIPRRELVEHYEWLGRLLGK